MPDLAVKDINNKDAGTMALSEDVFSAKANIALMHEAVRNYLANQRQGTASTKTKGLVRGGGKKPYKQKGTGRARAGSSRSPLFRGGGTTFGPSPRDYYYRMPKKARKSAFYDAISAKILDGEVTVIDALNISEPNTKQMATIINNLSLGGSSLLVVTESYNNNLVLSARNIPGVSVMRAGDLHAYDVISHSKVLITKDALKTIEDGAKL